MVKTMKIAALRERAKGENRAALTPDVVKLLVLKQYKVFVEKGIGINASFSDEEYTEAGAVVSAVPLEIISDADIILKVQPTPLVDQFNEIDLARSGAIIIGLLSPYNNGEYITKSLSRKLSTIAMELVPRVTKAQNMDALSSQSNLAGYRAVLEAGYYYEKAFPMMMTAAGTISPAKVLVIGAGVAGLQAIATAKRLGGVVSAYDVRSVSKEQVESLGAKFVYPEITNPSADGSGGYAKEVSKDFAAIQEQFLSGIIAGFDIVITTAQIPGKRAPLLITREMTAKMKSGSVIVDMSTLTGGNVEDSAADKIIVKKGVKIIGWTNMAAKVACDSSRLYAKNLYNFLEYAMKGGKMNFNDELVEEMLIGMEGKVINKKFKV
jgi:NAD(P) transhydrogenase subunit alpha